MSIALKRVYEEASADDGYRVLVDRLWPRGLSREKAGIDEWMKEIAPSGELRKWFHEDPASRWGAFRKKYLAELKSHREELRRLARLAEKRRLTLVFSAADERRNNAVVVRQYLRMIGSGGTRS